jgi:hypothetical protein
VSPLTGEEDPAKRERLHIALEAEVRSLRRQNPRAALVLASEQMTPEFQKALST